MKRALWLCVLLPLLGLSAAAEPFGLPFPVTNTRYRAAFGEPRLVTNDRDFFLFWGAEKKIRAARIDDGEPRVSHVVLDTYEDYDVAWTDEQYLIVSTRSARYHPYDAAVVGRILDAEAHPAGAEFAMGIADGEMPRLAVGTQSIALVYKVYAPPAITETRLVLLSKNGRPIEASNRVLVLRGGTHAVTRMGDGFLVIIAMSGGVRAVVLNRDGQTIGESTFAAAPNTFRHVAVASDGTNALAVWCEDTKVVAVTVNENAQFGAPLELFGLLGSHRKPTVVWNGASWTVAYSQRNNWTTAQAVIMQIHWRGQSVLSREEGVFGTIDPTVAALDGRMLAAWRTNGPNGSPIVQGLPLAEHQPRPAPWMPRPQTLLASASSDAGLLTVWSEKIDGGVSIHAGVRSRQGQWSERQLMTSPTAPLRAVAASDDTGFAVLISSSYTSSSLIRLDSAGRVSGEAVPLPFAPHLMAWNGTSYALVEENGYGVLVSPTGVVSAFVEVATEFAPSALASDGNGFFVAGDVWDCPFMLCSPIGVRGARLGPDLKRVDPEDYVIVDGASVIGAAWDGSKYFVIGDGGDFGNFIADIPLSPRSAIDVKEFAGAENLETMALLRDGTIAAAGRKFPYDAASTLVISQRDGSFLHRYEIDGSPTTAPRLEALADGGVAFLISSTQNAAPHDGTSRIVTAIARSSNVAPPSAPHVGVRVQNGSIHVDWSAPSGTVNGYRLEYRIDDDEWVELEQWFPPGSQRKTIRVPSFGTQFAFRVRAFNDGGAGEYSQTAFTKPTRRRAVR